MCCFYVAVGRQINNEDRDGLQKRHSILSSFIKWIKVMKFLTDSGLTSLSKHIGTGYYCEITVNRKDMQQQHAVDINSHAMK